LLPNLAPAAAPRAPLPLDLALLPANVMGLASFRPGELLRQPSKDMLKLLLRRGSLAEVEKELLLGVPPAEVERATLVLVKADQPALVVRTRKPFHKAALLNVLGDSVEEKTLRGKTVHFAREGNAVWLAGKDVFVVSIDRQIEGLTALLAEGNKGPVALAPAAQLAAQGRHAVVISFAVADAVRDLSRELLRGADLGAADRRIPRDKVTRDWVVARLPVALLPYKPLLLARTATLLLRPTEAIDGEVRVAFADAAGAADGELSLRTARYVAREALPLLAQGVKDRFPELATALVQAGQAALKEARVEREGTELKLVARVRLDREAQPALLAALKQRVLEGRARAQLRQLGIAMHNYADSTGTMPPAALIGSDGKPAVSWRVLLLPYLGPEENKLYKEFRLDQPWDSPHNKKLLPRMPKVFAPVVGKTKEPHSTFYRVFTGPNTPFKGSRGPRMPADFPDGTSNTILIAEASAAVPWTKPDELAIDPNKPLPKLGAQFPGVFLIVFADGSSRLVRLKTPEKVLRWLIDPSDGMVIPNLDD
jgi:hypothetical protein